MYGLPGALPATGMGALTIILGLAGFALVILGALIVRVNLVRSGQERAQDAADHEGKHVRSAAPSAPAGPTR